MTQPPFYILFANSSISASNTGALSNTLGHPAIQYTYADDSPLSLWPRQPNEHVLVLDYDPMTNSQPPTIRSMSKDLVVSGLKIEEAPGAAVTDENNPINDRMYIIDTTVGDVTEDDVSGDRSSAVNILAQFKRRNAILRQALPYTNAAGRSTHPQPWSTPASPQRPYP